jgi:hypothetical protein
VKRVQIEPEKRPWLEEVAHRRSDRKAAWDRGNRWAQSSDPSYQRHLFGVKCEYAVARLLGLEIDATHRPRGDRNEPDLRLPDGTGVTVKGRTHPGWAFALRGTDPAEFGSGVGVLVWPDPAGDDWSVEVVGWIDRSTFEQVAHLQDFKYGPRLVVEPDQMAPIAGLEGWVCPTRGSWA